MIYNILKENRYIFPFLTKDNKVAKNNTITLNKEILLNSFNHMLNELIEENYRKIFNTDLIIENIKLNKMVGLSQLEYLCFFLLGQVYDDNKFFIHKDIIKNTFFIKGDKILKEQSNIPFNFDNENNIYSFDINYKPFYIFNVKGTYIVFIQSGLNKETQKLVYMYLKQEYLNNKKYDNIHYLPFNFSNIWTQLLFNYISDTMVLEDIRNIGSHENDLPTPENIDPTNPTFKKLI